MDVHPSKNGINRYGFIPKWIEAYVYIRRNAMISPTLLLINYIVLLCVANPSQSKIMDNPIAYALNL